MVPRSTLARPSPARRRAAGALAWRDAVMPSAIGRLSRRDAGRVLGDLKALTRDDVAGGGTAVAREVAYLEICIPFMGF
jgi:hypothetical protein